MSMLFLIYRDHVISNWDTLLISKYIITDRCVPIQK